MTPISRLLALPALAAAVLSLSAPAADLVVAEYYIDSDPGPGNGTAITGMPPGGDNRLSVEVPAATIAALPIGVHWLTVRFLDANGNWSVAFSRAFERIDNPPSEEPRLVLAEYYFDTDPGPGQGTPTALAPFQESRVSVMISPATIAGLSPGLHWLTVRTLDTAGNWSVAFSRAFEKDDSLLEPNPLLAAIEYRWFSNGQPVGEPMFLTPEQPATAIGFQAVASVAGLTEGLTYQLVATPLDTKGKRGDSASVPVTVNITDNDGDGITDSWETSHGLNPALAADATLDPDGDGLANLAEFTRGTNPRKRDTSGDGIDDGLAIALGLDPLKAHPEVASRLAKLAEGQVRALYPGRPLLTRDDQSGLFHLRLGVQETGDLQTWQKLPVGAGEAVIENGDLIFSFSGTEPNRFYRIDAGE